MHIVPPHCARTAPRAEIGVGPSSRPAWMPWTSTDEQAVRDEVASYKIIENVAAAACPFGEGHAAASTWLRRQAEPPKSATCTDDAARLRALDLRLLVGVMSAPSMRARATRSGARGFVGRDAQHAGVLRLWARRAAAGGARGARRGGGGDARRDLPAERQRWVQRPAHAHLEAARLVGPRRRVRARRRHAPLRREGRRRRLSAPAQPPPRPAQSGLRRALCLWDDRLDWHPAVPALQVRLLVAAGRRRLSEARVSQARPPAAAPLPGGHPAGSLARRRPIRRRVE